MCRKREEQTCLGVTQIWIQYPTVPSAHYPFPPPPPPRQGGATGWSSYPCRTVARPLKPESVVKRRSKRKEKKNEKSRRARGIGEAEEEGWRRFLLLPTLAPLLRARGAGR
eukprot:8393127-Pyramimonas_sp.AAC.1